MTFHSDTIAVDGKFVSQKVSEVVEAIRDYSPELDVKWIPPEARKSGAAAYQIWHSPGNREPYIAFTVRRDEDMDWRILQRIIVNDAGGRADKTTMSDLEAAEAAQNAIKKQQWLDEMEEANDIAVKVLRSPLNDYRVSKDLRIKDGIPFNAANL